MKLLRMALVALSLGLTLALVARTVTSNEATIAQGQDVYIELAPVDPLSLVQGYYMTLSMPVRRDASTRLEPAWWRDRLAIFDRDDRRVGRFVRVLDTDESAGDVALEPDQVLLPVSWVGDRTVDVQPNSFLFEDGQAELFERARYGHFRALGDGRSVLIGLADAELQPLGRIPRSIEARP